MKAFGISLDYRFSWYFRGPYSPSLTRQLYEIGNIDDRFGRKKFTDDNYQTRFLQCIEFIGDKKNDEKWLEAVASIYYLKKSHPNLDKEGIINIFLDLKPTFSRGFARQVWEKLIEYNLVS